MVDGWLVRLGIFGICCLGRVRFIQVFFSLHPGASENCYLLCAASLVVGSCISFGLKHTQLSALRVCVVGYLAVWSMLGCIGIYRRCELCFLLCQWRLLDLVLSCSADHSEVNVCRFSWFRVYKENNYGRVQLDIKMGTPCATII